MPAMRSRQRSQFLILLADIAILYLSLLVALVLRSGQMPSAATWRAHVLPFSLAFIGWILIFYTAGLYALETAFDGPRFAGKLLGATAIATLGTALMFYLDRGADIAPKTVLALFALVAYALLGAWRWSLGRLSRLRFPKVGVAFVGATPETDALARATAERPILGYETRFVLASGEPCDECGGSVVAGDASGLAAAVREGSIDLVVIADENRLDDPTTRELYGLLERRVRFMRLPEFYEIVFRRIPIGAINEAWFLENINLGAKRPYEIVKRALDLAAGLAALAISSPLWPLFAVAIKLGSRGPVFFRQTRLGRGDKPFRILKFRTVRTEGNTFAPTGERDPRITRLGSFLRATRLDELPQMLNILAGDMSFVGPRPERPELAEELAKAIPYYRQRHLVKPGITGWDQVSGEYHSPSVEDTRKKLQYDLYYIKNMSPFLDVSIFFKTIMTVLARSGR